MPESEFIKVRPYIPEKWGLQDVDEGSATCQSIEWLLEKVPENDGKLGVLTNDTFRC